MFVNFLNTIFEGVKVVRYPKLWVLWKSILAPTQTVKTDLKNISENESYGDFTKGRFSVKNCDLVQSFNPALERYLRHVQTCVRIVLD